MKTDTSKLPDDPAELRKMLLAVMAEKQLLEEKNSLLEALLFGRSSEKRGHKDDRQGELFDEAEIAEGEDEIGAKSGDEEETQTVTYTRKKPKRKPLPKDLPRVEIIHDVEDHEKDCPCGCRKKCIGEEVSEKLVIKRPEVYVEKHIRPKYACRDCEGVEDDGPSVVIAPVPPQILPKTIASPELLAYIITAKFCDHLPFYRLSNILKRYDISISRATMSDWAIKIATLCAVMLDLMQKEMLSGPLICADETTVQVLGEVGRENAQKSYMWVFRGGGGSCINGKFEKPVVIFQYHPGRSGQIARDFLKGYKGWVQTDGYSGYNWIEATPGMKHIGCMGHARRKFTDATKAVGGKKRRSSSADVALGFIQKLYAIEKRARQKELNPAQIRALRQKKAVPVLNELKAWLDKMCIRVNPKGLLGKAIGYMLRQWPRLILYVEDGQLNIDNNLTENSIRPFCLGRKNWLFSGSPRGASSSAALYSLIETARACGHEPFAYLSHLFYQLPLCGNKDDYRKLLPMNIAQETK
jgi:transposase